MEKLELVGWFVFFWFFSASFSYCFPFERQKNHLQPLRTDSGRSLAIPNAACNKGRLLDSCWKFPLSFSVSAFFAQKLSEGLKQNGASVSIDHLRAFPVKTNVSRGLPYKKPYKSELKKVQTTVKSAHDPEVKFLMIFLNLPY